MGQLIEYADGKFKVPDNPIVPYVEGDGTGPDIWRAAVRVLDAAVAKAYKGKRKIEWLEVLAGEKSFKAKNDWLPKETMETIVKHRVAIKGPLGTPVGGGIRSLNVTLRQELDLYQCVRPVRYYPGTPSPMKQPELLDVVIFRENTEDVYAGVEWASGTAQAKEVIELVKKLGKKIRDDSGIGIKPISPFGSKRLVRAGIRYALEHGRKRVTLVHKGNIMKFTEGSFRDWGYEVAKQEFRAQCVTETESWILDNKDQNPSLSIEANAAMVEPGIATAPKAAQEKLYAEVKGVLDAIYATHGNGKWKKLLLVNDRIADSMFQQVLLRPKEYDVVCTPNLNGDYLSDACAAQVGGIGIAPGANIGDGFAIFEATHGTAPKYAGQDKVNPGSVILSGNMMLELFGWKEAAKLVDDALGKAILAKKVTYDFARLMEGATLLKCSEFASFVIECM